MKMDLPSSFQVKRWFGIYSKSLYMHVEKRQLDRLIYSPFLDTNSCKSNMGNLI